MTVAYFPSLPEADVLEIVFFTPQGNDVPLRLLVDSGFTGQSSFVLPKESDSLIQSLAPASEVTGAIQGLQKRVVVIGQIPAQSFQFAAIAILADTSSLTLPGDVQGIVGLRILRQFRRWGAELTAAGGWHFFLEH